ncbi:hypothetical protein JOC59_000476 [Weissella beninensis]|uniref:Poly-beta-1,6-N-acetyl-D-glucosamine biosynthesis protein PgaD n=1 Tax=Periweissella beninensis TaxID=504936 RepID=A0ABT0VG87_9LACO|nr:hypothetical protein [Periweissella beninensis]MBM7543772.1 hypothetical protein [Periweissella beninensis]MCM2436844.1 hypothetical protein [Periweissella beninensis]
MKKKYTDLYFEKGNILTKIWQTIVMIIGWGCIFLPIYLVYKLITTKNNIEFFKISNYADVLKQFELVTIILIFTFIIVIIFCVSLTFIQNTRKTNTSDHWPMFNPIDQQEKELIFAKIVDKRFGTKEFRENINYYEVDESQNFEVDELFYTLKKEK